MEKVTSEQVLNIIDNLENSERWDLLNKMYDLYYNKTDRKGVEICDE